MCPTVQADQGDHAPEAPGDHLAPGTHEFLTSGLRQYLLLDQSFSLQAMLMSIGRLKHGSIHNKGSSPGLFLLLLQVLLQMWLLYLLYLLRLLTLQVLLLLLLSM